MDVTRSSKLEVTKWASITFNPAIRHRLRSIAVTEDSLTTTTAQIQTHDIQSINFHFSSNPL